ncbi:MAG: hypothetical protein BGO14_03150 [Chlamydiales bacterium 38-26]|nr:hypothetical protein [Chlamydiales bacterium]OJV09335.1 MAG: hypothetical protein BGO14_03150 [Chlamydiales bacterium 38-26]
MLKYKFAFYIIVLFSIQLNLLAQNCENFSSSDTISISWRRKTNSIYMKRVHKDPLDYHFKKKFGLFYTLGDLKPPMFYSKKKVLDFELNALDLFSPKYKISANSRAYNFLLLLARSHQQDSSKKPSGGTSKVRLNYSFHSDWFLDLRFDHIYQYYTSDPSRSTSDNPSTNCIKVGAGVGYKF